MNDKKVMAMKTIYCKEWYNEMKYSSGTVSNSFCKAALLENYSQLGSLVWEPVHDQDTVNTSALRDLNRDHVMKVESL